MLPIALIIFNIAALLFIIITATLMARWGYTFTQNIGDSPITTKLMWRILKALLVLMVITTIAAAVNAIFVAI